MRPKYRPTTYDTAILTIYLVKSFDEEQGPDRKTSRFRLSERTLRTISLRSSLRGSFLDEWIDELGLLGWSAFPFEDHFALIERGSVNSWARIGSARIGNVLRRLHNGESQVLDEIEQQVAPEPEPPAADDDGWSDPSNRGDLTQHSREKKPADQVKGRRGHGLRICLANLDKSPQKRVKLMFETPAENPRDSFRSLSEAVRFHNWYPHKGYGAEIDAMTLHP